jgi:uncharacterized membrane protein YfcA
MKASLIKGLPAAVAGILGVVLAGAWYASPLIGVIAIVVLALVAGYAWRSRRQGMQYLRGTPRRPVEAVPLLERWAIFILAAGAVGAAVLIVAAASLAGLTPTGTPEVQKQLLTAAFAVVTALVTASLVKGLEDFNALVAEPIQEEFEAAYEGCYAPESDEWRAIFDVNFDAEVGWQTPAGRRARALAVNGKPCAHSETT